LAAVLDFQPDMTVVAHASDGQEAVAKFRECLPDIVLMDLAMPSGCAHAILEIGSAFPEARVIVLTTYDGDENIFRALEKWGRGYLRRLLDGGMAGAIGRCMREHARVAARAAARLAERTMGGRSFDAREIEVLSRLRWEEQ